MRRRLVLLIIVVRCIAAAETVTGEWSRATRLTFSPGASGMPSVAVAGAEVHVAWADNTPGNVEIYYTRSIDTGETWSEPRRLTYDSSHSGAPSIAAAGGSVHLVWYDRSVSAATIFYKRSIDQGVTWSTDRPLTNAGVNAAVPKVVVAGADVHVVWWDTTGRRGTAKVFHKRSTDGGTTWRTRKRLSARARNSGFPSLAVAGIELHVTWDDLTDPKHRACIYRRSVDGGVTWSKRAVLAKDARKGGGPVVAAVGRAAHAAWVEGLPGRTALVHARSLDAGATWSDAQELTPNGPLGSPTLAVAGSRVFLAWLDFGPGNAEIFFRNSGDGGASWSAARRLSSNSGDSMFPALAEAGSKVHLVWDDRTPGREEVFYRRFDLAPLRRQ